jgi:hypothetical protein
MSRKNPASKSIGSPIGAPVLLDSTEVCVYLRMSPRSLDRLSKTGGIPNSLIAGKRLFDRDDVVKYFANQKIGAL